MTVSRRRFLQGCCAGIAAMSGVRVNELAWADTAVLQSRHPIVIHIFLRGGMDALSFLPPHADSRYHAGRKELGLDASQVIDVDGYFGFHPTAERLHEIFRTNQLAVINAVGLPEVNRSHFKAQEIMELASVDGHRKRHKGWLARYLEHAAGDSIFKGVGVGSTLPASMQGSNETISIGSNLDFGLPGDGREVLQMRRSLRGQWGADSRFGSVALRALDAFDMFEAYPLTDYEAANGAEYENWGLGQGLRSIAQIIRRESGLMAATLDMGGWDTHENQTWGDGIDGHFNNLVRELSNNLHAFWTDLQEYHDRLTVVVMSEFGRRLRENNNRGTDHGHAGLMLVLSHGVTEQKVFGDWPGLETDQLTERADLRVTTDYRSVIAEIIRDRTNLDDARTVFPEFAKKAETLGLFSQG